MSKLTLENITIKDHKIYDQDGKYRGEILYEYIRGSKLYHTDVATSDEDHGGIYIMPNETKLGIGLDYQNEIKDESNDKCIWEVGRFLELALSSNPTVLEALFVPDDKVIYEHPVIKELRSHADVFVTKKCFKPFGGYAESQIARAQGQNKKIHWDMEQVTRKTPLDFCFTFKSQGSENIQDWLKERGLDQRNCGLVNVPNMPDVYGVYYDWGQHIRLAGITKEYFTDEKNYDTDKFIKTMVQTLRDETDWIEELNFEDLLYQIWDKFSTPIGGYTGIVSPNLDSNTIRFSSVKKGQKPICFMTYNANAYATHCKKYKEYEEWKNHRNPARYESNMEGEKSGNPDLKYDCKNMMHCFRLMAMAKEIAEGKGVILDRTGIDRDFLLEVRNRKYGYSELQKRMLQLKDEMDEAIKNSTIKDEIDARAVDNLLLEVRKMFNK
jgi:predicted nucleotidyltransferase